MSEASASAETTQPAFPMPGEVLQFKPRQEDEWAPILPVPQHAPRNFPAAFPPSRGAKPSAWWMYTDIADRMLGVVVRFDYADGTKAVLPLTYCRGPNGSEAWHWKAFRKPHPMYGLFDLAARPEAPVLVCEGEKTTEAARNHFPGHVAVTSPGGANAGHLADWSHLSGRKVTIWPDNDAAGRSYASVVAQAALAAGAVSVALVEVPDAFPEGWDVADPLPEGWTPDCLRELLDAARPIEAGQAGATAGGAGAEETTAGLNIGSDVELAQRLVDRLVRQYGNGAVVHCDGRFWAFKRTHWSEINANDLRRLGHDFDGMPKANGGPVRLTRNRIDSILNEAGVILDKPDLFDDPPIGVNCASGFIVIGKEGIAVHPHQAAQRQRHVIAGNWREDSVTLDDPNGPKGTSLAKFLEGCFRDDPDAAEKIMALQEIAGAVLFGLGTKIPNPKAIVLFGASAENGKSQFLNLLRGLVPGEAVASVSPCKMADPTYLAQLDNILLNASDEMSSAKSIASDHFKAVITGDPLMAHRKYKDPRSFRSRAQHVFATNDLPHFEGGMDRGVRRRLLVIEFKRTIPLNERVPDIGKKIAMEEADFLLAWAVAGARRLLAACRYNEPQSSAEVLNDWVIGSNPVLAWMEERAEVRYGHPRPWTLVKEAYAAFKKWAAAMGFPEHRLPSQNIFAQRVYATGKGVDKARRSDGAIFVGLVLRDG